MTISTVADTVKIERHIQATPAQIYALLTSRDALSTWFCDSAYSSGEVGRAYLVSWRQERYHASGTYLELEPDHKLTFTWRGKDDQFESTVRIVLSTHDGHTALTLTHEGLPDQDVLQYYQREWEKGLDKLQLHAEIGALPDVVNRVIVGIRPGPVSTTQAQAIGIAEGAGTLVTGLVPGFSAEKAGILEGDIITALDGQETTAERPMNILTQGRKPGEQISVTFYRDGVQHTLNMELKGYPVPEIPPTFAALADHIEQEYAQISAELDDLFSGVTAEQARKRPADAEWSADHVLAHLIYSERYAHEELGGRITNRAPQHWSGNDDTRLNALLAIYPTHEALLAEFKSRMRETVVILRNFPEAAISPVTLWGSAFSLDGWVQHTRGHFSQIRAALA